MTGRAATGSVARRGRLVVVGCGPVGMVAALLLRRRFAEVVVLEQQSRERLVDPGRGRTFPIVLSPATERILARVGALEPLRQGASEYFGVVLHKRLLGRDLAFRSRRAGIHAHWRERLVGALHDRLVAEGITVHFGTRLVDLDLGGRVATADGLPLLPFDLLIGADGVHSTVRELVADAGLPDGAFGRSELDAWYAYRLPCTGALRDRFGAGPRFEASHVFVDDPPGDPRRRFRVVTTNMRHPADELSVFIKHGRDLDATTLRALNDAFLAPFGVDRDELDRAWTGGHAGVFSQVRASRFHAGRTLLVGDAAHGFESNGDLVNLGIASVADLEATIDGAPDLDAALRSYDATTGEALRRYAELAHRRSRDVLGLEVALFAMAAPLGLVARHPAFFGTYGDDFAIVPCVRRYLRDVRRTRLLALAAVAVLATAGAALVTALA